MKQVDLSEKSVATEATRDHSVGDVGEVHLDDQGKPISQASDIVFDCEHCGHQLVIDVRGAGLTVNCTECGETVEVPIPEGMEVADLDGSAEQLFTQILHLRQMLSRAEGRVTELEQVVASLLERRSVMEKMRSATLHRCAEGNNLLQSVIRTQGEITGMVQRVQILLADEQKNSTGG